MHFLLLCHPAILRSEVRKQFEGHSERELPQKYKAVDASEWSVVTPNPSHAVEEPTPGWLTPD